MEPIILNGKEYSKEIEEDLKVRVKALKQKGITPTLATILVGDDTASAMYVKMKGKACERVGIESRKIVLPGNTTTEELVDVINDLNNDSSVYGILLQHPVPRTIDENKCFNTISPEKDVDGVNVVSFGRFAMKQPAFISCTPYGVVRLLKKYNIELKGKRAVIVGRSPILGKPLSMLLLNEDCTVTICHSKTVDLDIETERADIVVGCVGSRNLITKVKPGAVIVDCGYSADNVGDIDKNCTVNSLAYTPIPGGVGPMTIAMLLEQTVISAENSLN
jgi:methylenetetrahydrofolate dehydrogenase (NADP+)/methenyltetrahydrofolate cyclohydrolase